MGVPGSLGFQPSPLPPPVTHPCFLLLSSCQGEPGGAGEPGDPGEDVSRGCGGELMGSHPYPVP